MELDTGKGLRPEVKAWEQRSLKKGMFKEETHYDSGFSDGSYYSSRLDSSCPRSDSTKRLVVHDDDVGYESISNDEPASDSESTAITLRATTQLSEIAEAEVDGSEQTTFLTEDVRTLKIAPAARSIHGMYSGERDDVYTDNTHYQNYACSGDALYLLAPFRDLLSISNDDGDTALHLAVINGRVAVVNQFLLLRPNDADFIDSANNLGQTALHLAIITNQLAMAELLLAAGADPKKVDRNGNTPLHLAAIGGLRQVVAMILSTCDRRGLRRRELLEQRNFEGITAFHVASRWNRADTMAFLAYHGASVDAQDYSSGRSALHHAIENNQLSVAGTLLFQLKADVNAVTFDGCTALHLAAGRGLCDMVAVLIAAGADSTIRSAEDDLPIDLTRNEQIIKILSQTV